MPASIDQDVSVTLSAYHFVDESLSATRSRNSFNGSFDKGSLGVDEIENVEYKFTLPAYWNGMEVTVILNGLEPADAKLTGGSGNTYTYKPAAGGAQTLTLRTINLEEKECSITLKADGYNDETDKIDQRGSIVIPAGGLTATLQTSYFAQTGTISIYSSNQYNNASLITTYNYTREEYRKAVNADEIILQVPDNVTTLYFRYNNYYRGSVDVDDLLDGKAEVTLTSSW